MMPLQYDEEPLNKALRCRDLYAKCALIEKFIKTLDAFIRHTMREYWGNKKDTNFCDLASHATSMHMLPGHNVSSNQTS